MESHLTLDRKTPARSSLPQRYQENWLEAFLTKATSGLRPGVAVLDLGSGRTPALKPELRPADCTYVGLDISESELLLAPEGSYDELVVSDITEFHPELVNRFDLVVSWQVLEHVKPLSAALDNAYRYLKPSGRFVAQFSGTFSAFGLINQVIPSSVGPWVLKTLLGRDPGTVFPAYYDKCWHGKIDELLAGWSEQEIVSRYNGAGYWNFLPPLKAAYLMYENWAADKNHRNLATHYLVDARR